MPEDRDPNEASIALTSRQVPDTYRQPDHPDDEADLCAIATQHGETGHYTYEGAHDYERLLSDLEASHGVDLGAVDDSPLIRKIKRAYRKGLSD